MCCAILLLCQFLDCIEHLHHIPAQVDAATQNNIGFAVGSQVVFGYSFLLASFVLFLVAEKESKVCRYRYIHTVSNIALNSSLRVVCHSSSTQAKHLQFVSGVHTTSYWLANFAWDLLNAAVPIIITLILFAAFQVDAYSGEGLGAVFLLFVSMHA